MRRRILRGTLCLFLSLLTLIGPETVVAQYNDMMLYKNLVAVAASIPAETTTSYYLYRYDDNGNTIARYDDTFENNAFVADTFDYDYENRLIAADMNIGPSPGGTTTYLYDADGIRAGKSSGNLTTRYVTDKNQPYAQVLVEATTPEGDDPQITTYVYGDDLIRMKRPGATSNDPAIVRYYHYDGQMSVRQLTAMPDQSNPAPVTDEYTYDAFGNLVEQTGSTVNDYRYTGEQYDPNVGFYYLRARYMNPAIGRFVNRDSYSGSSQDPMSLHKYLYANCNPINGSDPAGLFTVNEMNVVSAINNLVTSLSRISQAYRRVKQLINLVDSVSTILELASLDVHALFNEIRSHMRLDRNSFGKYFARFSAAGISEGVEALTVNVPRIIGGILGKPEKMLQIGQAFEGSNPAFVIKLPTPPYANPLAAIPPIPILRKLGRLRIPVYLSFATRSQTGRFVGLAVAKNCRSMRFDQDAGGLSEFFHMDYQVHDNGNRMIANHDWWYTAGKEFEFQIPKNAAFSL